MADYASLKVAELKKLLGEKGLSDKGNKPDLVARLKEHDEANGGKPGTSQAHSLCL
jgi:SAP domain-containing ribonucleoprotein